MDSANLQIGSLLAQRNVTEILGLVREAVLDLGSLTVTEATNQALTASRKTRRPPSFGRLRKIRHLLECADRPFEQAITVTCFDAASEYNFETREPPTATPGPAIAGNFPFPDLIRSTKNQGFLAVYNIAAKITTSEFILVLNPDVDVQPGASDSLLKLALENPTPRIWGGPTILPSESRLGYELRGYNSECSVNGEDADF